MKRLKRRQMPTTGVRTGTLTLTLLIISIVLAIVSVLALQTAKSNLVHASAFVETTESYYQNDAAAQTMLAQIGSDGLDAARASGAIPAQATVEGDIVRVVFMDGAPGDASAVVTDVIMDNGGMATSGLNNEDKTSRPALLVELDFGKKGPGNAGYSIATWNQIRVYD